MNETPKQKPNIYSNESTAALRGATASPEFQTLHEIVKKARQNLDQNDWDYIVGGTESETTLRRNRMALDSLAFRPRVLRDVSRIDAAVERFGRRLRLPVVLAPVGALEVFHQGGGATAARAAQEFGVAHMLSSVCEPGLEAVAEAAPDALRIYQLYVRGDEGFVDDHVRRAIANGYSAFCLTVDTAVYSRRERDLAKRFVTAGRRRVSGREFQAALAWRTVERIKRNFQIPLALKGIATREDAARAVEHDVDWIYVSNHGGRQLDHGLGSMEVLPEIVEAVGDRAKRRVLPRHRYRQADDPGRGSRRARPHAMLRSRGGRAGRHRAHARAHRGRGAALSRPARRDEFRRARSFLPARGGARQSAARAQRVPAAADRGLSVLNL